MLRIGIERGMVATIAVVAPLLALLAVPGYAADHQSHVPLTVVAPWCVAGCMLAAIPMALTRPGTRGWAWLWGAVACFVALIVMEPFTLASDLPIGSTPWLLALSYVAVACVSVATTRPFGAALICAGIDGSVTGVYAGELPLSHLAINAAGLALAAAVCIVTIRLRRRQANRVDAAEQHARRLHERHQRASAFDAERVRTDALLHDSVLATLLAAAGGHAPQQTATMAQSALTTMSSMECRSVEEQTPVAFDVAFVRCAPNLDDAQNPVRVDIVAVADLLLPPDVADALVAATLQALTNSIKHAGSEAHRAVTAIHLGTGGIRITVSDDGAGFDTRTVDQERLGLRVSIMEQVERVDGSATVLSSPGNGTVIHLEWTPPETVPLNRTRSFETTVKLIPRRQLNGLLGGFIVVAILTAISEAVLITRAVGPIISAVLGLAVLPALLRGARTGTMRRRTAWAIAVVGMLLCCTATLGLDPNAVDAISLYWYTCGILAGAIMVWMAGHRAPPLVAVTALAVQLTIWAGPAGTIRLGLAAEIVLIIAGVMMYQAIGAVTTAADTVAAQQRQLAARQAERDALHHERLRRLRHASATITPMLRRIVKCRGVLDTAARAECRLIEHALRDEIRGRHILNDAMREVISAQRRRGADVQILDDGGLETIPTDELDALLNDVARRLAPVHAHRIIVRTGSPDSDTALTLVATIPDEVAAALGIDGEDDVELWENVPRPRNQHRGAPVRTLAQI